MSNIDLGKIGENLALEYLSKKGYRLLARNLRLFCGEIDILMQEKDSLIIVEVKTKTTSHFATPQEQVHYKKQQKLRQLARALESKFPKRPIRIDVVAVDEEAGKIDHIISAVEG